MNTKTQRPLAEAVADFNLCYHTNFLLPMSHADLEAAAHMAQRRMPGLAAELRSFIILDRQPVANLRPID